MAPVLDGRVHPARSTPAAAQRQHRGGQRIGLRRGALRAPSAGIHASTSPPPPRPAAGWPRARRARTTTAPAAHRARAPVLVPAAQPAGCGGSAPRWSACTAGTRRLCHRNQQATGQGPSRRQPSSQPHRCCAGQRSGNREQQQRHQQQATLTTARGQPGRQGSPRSGPACRRCPPRPGC